MSETKGYEALSSTSRRKILKLLHKEPLSIEKIAKLVKLQQITVRHHLQSLEDAGFIESYEEKTGSVGRPKTIYKISREPTVVGYPKRRYLTLSNYMIKTLRLLVGSKRADKILRNVGKSMGENVIKEIELKHDIREWSTETFVDFFIKGYLEDAGAEPEIVKIGKSQVVYRVHNCLFLELSIKMPDVMCEVLHESFHEGVTDAVGGKIRIARLTCQGHGDPYCEHKGEWNVSPR